MKRETLLFLFILVLGCAIQAKASSDYRSFYTQYDDSLLNKLTDIDRQTKIFISKDTLRGYSTPRKIEAANYFTPISKEDKNINRDRNGLIIVPFEYDPFLSYMNFSDTIILDPSMLPVVFDGKMLPSDLGFESNYLYQKKNNLERFLIDRDSLIAPSLYQYNKAQENEYKLIKRDNTFDSNLWRIRRVQDKRRKYYAEHPQLIKSNALEYTQLPSLKDELEKKNPFQNLISAENTLQISRPELEKVEIKQKFWKTSAIHELKVSQKSYSSNWAPSTDDNFQLQNYHKFTADYKRDKIEFTHWIEWRFNAQYTRLPGLEEGVEDNRTRFLINDDWIKTYNRLGLTSFIKKWSYILNLDIKTPLFDKHPQNNKKDKLASLFSPLEMNFGLGAGYKLEKKSKNVRDRMFKLSIDATPLSLSFKYVKSDKVWDKNKYGVVYDPQKDKGKTAEDRRYSKTEFGSTLNATIAYKFNGYIDLSSRIHYFTNYHKAYMECENTFNFQLNRYLATSLYVYMRFDDSVGPEKKHKHDLGYFSFNQVLGFGLSYRW